MWICLPANLVKIIKAQLLKPLNGVAKSWKTLTQLSMHWRRSSPRVFSGVEDVVKGGGREVGGGDVLEKSYEAILDINSDNYVGWRSP